MPLGEFFGADNLLCGSLSLGGGLPGVDRSRVLGLLTASNVLMGEPLLVNSSFILMNFGRTR